jgi:hypothetical protein
MSNTFFLPSFSPSPEELKAIREKLGITMEQAAKLVRSAPKTWKGWEQPVGTPGHRRMPVAIWELFVAKTVLDAEIGSQIEYFADMTRVRRCGFGVSDPKDFVI